MRYGWALVLVLALVRPVCAGEAAERFDNDVYPLSFRVQVNDAIRAGVAHLRTKQQADGSFAIWKDHPAGRTALAALALLKCGVKPTDPAIEKAFAYIRTQKIADTYTAAVLLMALEAKYAPPRDPFSTDDYDKYGNLRDRDPCARAISKEDKAWMQEGVEFLLNGQNAQGVWRYAGPADFDLSNTQFALLGLHAATRCGGQVKSVVWLDALRFILEHQDKTGEPIEYRANEVRGRYRFEWTERALARPFRYVSSYGPTGSMTTAGLASLVICQNRLWRSRLYGGKDRATTRRAIRDAMAWMQRHFYVNHNPGWGANWHGYYLYGLERAGILGRFRFVGKHDWYHAGAQHILKHKMHLHNLDGCFSLLFLKRATSRMNAPVITPSGGPIVDPVTMPAASHPKWMQPFPDVPKDVVKAGAYWSRKLKDRDANVAFRATIELSRLSMLAQTKPLVVALRTHQDPYVRMSAAEALGKHRVCDAVRPLIENLLDGDDLVRHAANLALTRISTHKELVYRSTMNANERMRLVNGWRAWWKTNEVMLRDMLGQPR